MCKSSSQWCGSSQQNRCIDARRNPWLVISAARISNPQHLFRFNALQLIYAIPRSAFLSTPASRRSCRLCGVQSQNSQQIFQTCILTSARQARTRSLLSHRSCCATSTLSCSTLSSALNCRRERSAPCPYDTGKQGCHHLLGYFKETWVISDLGSWKPFSRGLTDTRITLYNCPSF